MKLLKTHEVRRQNQRQNNIINFYEYKGKYFRSPLTLETEEEYIEELGSRSTTYKTHEESLEAFYTVVEKQEAILLK